jgi:hypothetical protein
MIAPRLRTAVAAAGLSTLLAAGVAVPASAATPTASVASAPSVVSPVAASAAHSAAYSATAPFPGKSPAAVLTLSLAAGRKASGVHVKGVVSLDGEVDRVDLVITKAAAKGTFSSTASGSFTLLRIGSTVYLNGDSTFWTTSADAATAKALVGKWVKVTGNDANSKDTRALTTLGYWMSDLASFKVTKRVAGKAVRRLPTVGLLDPRADKGTIFVATRGKPYPLLVVSPDAKSSLAFYDWNKRVKIAAPPAKLVVVLP